MPANHVAIPLKRRLKYSPVFRLGVALLLGGVAFGSESTTAKSGAAQSSSQSDLQAPGDGKLLVKLDFESDQPVGWSLFQVGAAQGVLRRESVPVLDSGSSNVLLLVVTNVGERCGVTLRGATNFGAQSNEWYDLTFRARTEKRENDRGYGLTVSLESQDGKEVLARTTIPEVGGEWREYTVALHARLANPKAVLVITLSEPGAIWFDDVLLKQRQTGHSTRTP